MGPFLATKKRAFGSFLRTQKGQLFNVQEFPFLGSQKWNKCQICLVQRNGPNARFLIPWNGQNAFFGRQLSFPSLFNFQFFQQLGYK